MPRYCPVTRLTSDVRDEGVSQTALEPRLTSSATARTPRDISALITDISDSVEREDTSWHDSRGRSRSSPVRLEARGGHMPFGSLMMIVFWGGVILLIVLAVRYLGHGSAGGGERFTGAKTPLQILEERFARGEFDKEEFEQRKRALSG